MPNLADVDSEGSIGELDAGDPGLDADGDSNEGSEEDSDRDVDFEVDVEDKGEV